MSRPEANKVKKITLDELIKGSNLDEQDKAQAKELFDDIVKNPDDINTAKLYELAGGQFVEAALAQRSLGVELSKTSSPHLLKPNLTDVERESFRRVRQNYGIPTPSQTPSVSPAPSQSSLVHTPNVGMSRTVSLSAIGIKEGDESQEELAATPLVSSKGKQNTRD